MIDRCFTAHGHDFNVLALWYVFNLYATHPTPTNIYRPTAWGLTMAAYETKLPLADYAIFLAKFLFGAFLVRSSACTINDIFDRKMDAGVGQYPVSLPSHSYETHVFALRHE